MSFDPQFIEAQIALGKIGAGEMPALAWDALEAGFDGPSICRVAALINPSGWEIDQLMPSFMAEAGLKNISIQEASTRLARQLASMILLEGSDPLKYSRDFEALWIKSDYAETLQEVGSIDDQKAIAQYTGQTEADLREYARSVLVTLTSACVPTRKD